MSNPHKSMGTQHETAIVNWLKAHGWPWARRRTQKGSRDEGDLCLSERIPFTIEAKNAKGTTERVNIGGWLRELEAEVTNVGDEAGAVVIKRKGTTNVGEYVVLMPMKYLNELLVQAYGEGTALPLDTVELPSGTYRKRKRLIPRIPG